MKNKSPSIYLGREFRLERGIVYFIRLITRIFTFPLSFLRESQFKLFIRRFVLGFQNSLPTELAVSKGEVAIQIGTPRPRTVRRFSRAVGASGHVFVFEAEPVNFHRLQEAVKQEGLKNVTLIQGAAWSSNGEGELSLSPYSGDHKIRLDDVKLDNDLRPGNQQMERIKCRFYSIDDVLSEHGIKYIHYLSVTVNGAELEVLKGAKQTLLNSPGIRVYAKGHALQANGQHTRVAIQRWLENIGFRTMTTKGEPSSTTQGGWQWRSGDVFAWKCSTEKLLSGIQTHSNNAVSWTKSFLVDDIYQTILKRWLWILIGMVAGMALGYAFINAQTSRIVYETYFLPTKFARSAYPDFELFHAIEILETNIPTAIKEVSTSLSLPIRVQVVRPRNSNFLILRSTSVPEELMRIKHIHEKIVNQLLELDDTSLKVIINETQSRLDVLNKTLDVLNLASFTQKYLIAPVGADDLIFRFQPTSSACELTILELSIPVKRDSLGIKCEQKFLASIKEPLAFMEQLEKRKQYTPVVHIQSAELDALLATFKARPSFDDFKLDEKVMWRQYQVRNLESQLASYQLGKQLGVQYRPKTYATSQMANLWIALALIGVLLGVATAILWEIMQRLSVKTNKNPTGNYQ